jgi:hypothetical protein
VTVRHCCCSPQISINADKWGQLNEVLPPPKYTSGGSVAEALRARRPSSCPDLAALADAAERDGQGQGQEMRVHGGSSLDSPWPASLFHVSAAYPALKGIMAEESLRRASMGHGSHVLRQHWDLGAGADQEGDAAQAPGSPQPAAKPRLRRSKSMSDVVRSAKRAAMPVSLWPSHAAAPSAFMGASAAASQGVGNSSAVGMGPSAGSLWSSSRRPAQPTVGGGLPPGNLPVIEQEPSEYNSSYHGGS